MIKYERSNSRFPVIAVAGAAVVALAAAAWWASASRNDEASSDVVPPQASSSLWPQAGVGEDSAMAVASAPTLGDGRPSDVSEEDWAALLAAMTKQGQTKEDALRLVSFVRYQQGFEKWQTIDTEKDARLRRRMAESLMNQLPDRLKQGEFTLMEAAFMGAALIADLETDDSRRNQALVQWQMKMATLVPDFENDVAIAKLSRETEWKRLQASAYAEWQAQTDPSQRTPARLEQAMEEARRQFNSGAR